MGTVDNIHHPLEHIQTENNQGSINDEEELDPRIQVELERLNSAGAEINKMSSELEEARSQFRAMLSESTQKLNQLMRRNRKSIEKSRSYYAARTVAKKLQGEAQKSAIQFQRANIEYRAAKETIELAEQRFLLCTEEEKREFDSAWQEMLNHATMKVMQSEQDKSKSEKMHLEKAGAYQEAEGKVTILEKKHKRSISKALPFFELKSLLELKLLQQKQNVEDLQKGVQGSHKKYADALKNLELISEDIHAKRKDKILLMSPREPGVGAEDESLPEINLDNLGFHESYSSSTSFPSDLSEEDKMYQNLTDSDVFSQSEESGIFSISSLDGDGNSIRSISRENSTNAFAECDDNTAKELADGYADNELSFDVRTKDGYENMSIGAMAHLKVETCSTKEHRESDNSSQSDTLSQNSSEKCVVDISPHLSVSEDVENCPLTNFGSSVATNNVDDSELKDNESESSGNQSDNESDDDIFEEFQKQQ